MMERVYVDSTDLHACFHNNMYYDGTIKILSKNRPIKQLSWDSDGKWYGYGQPNPPNEEIFKTFVDWGILNAEGNSSTDGPSGPYEFDDIGCFDFAVIEVDYGEVISIGVVDWEKSYCTCECGEKVVHKTSPIPPGYGEVSNQDNNEEE